MLRRDYGVFVTLRDRKYLDAQQQQASVAVCTVASTEGCLTWLTHADVQNCYGDSRVRSRGYRGYSENNRRYSFHRIMVTVYRKDWRQISQNDWNEV